jgi:tetratricopeptide (TPR) repeat protein
VSAAERLWRWCRRNPRVAGPTALAAVLLLAVAGGSSVFAWTLDEKNKETTKARDAAVRAKDEAVQAAEQREKNTEAALAAMRTVVVRFRFELRGRPGLVQLRKKLTEGVLVDLRKLSADLKNQPIKDRSLAAAQVNLGEIYVELGDYTGSKEHFDAAEEILARLEKEQPENALAKRNLAAVLNAGGDVALRLGDGSEARQRYDRALRLRQQWHQMLADEVSGKRVPAPEENRAAAVARNEYEARLAIAQSYGLLGNASLKMGDPRAALGYYTKSKENYEAVPAEHFEKCEPALRLQYEFERSNLEERLGKCHMQLGQLDQARKHLTEALRQRIERVRKWANDAPDPVRRDMALSRCDMGDLELEYEHNPVAAAGYYRLACASLEILTKKAPDNPLFVQDLASADYRMGYACLRVAGLNRGAGAAAWVAAAQFHFDRARKNLEQIAPIDPADTSVQIQLLLAEARCGRHAEAAARADRLIKGSPKDPRVLFHTACGYALCAVAAPSREQAESYARTASATLGQALACGWQDAVALERDPDLDPLRGRPEYAALVRTLRPAGGHDQP